MLGGLDMNTTDFQKFDVVHSNVEFPDEGEGIQQNGTGGRYYIVVSNNIGNKYSPTLLVMPLTSKFKKNRMPTHYWLKWNQSDCLERNSTVLGEQVRALSKEQCKKVGKVTDDDAKKGITKAYFMASVFDEPDLKRVVENVLA